MTFKVTDVNQYDRLS